MADNQRYLIMHQLNPLYPFFNEQSPGLLNTSFQKKMLNTFDAFSGNLYYLGIFDYLTLGSFNLLDKMTSYIHRYVFSIQWPEKPDDKTKALRYGTKILTAASTIIDVLANFLIRNVVSLALSLLVSPIVLMVHGTALAIRNRKVKHIIHSLQHSMKMNSSTFRFYDVFHGGKIRAEKVIVNEKPAYQLSFMLPNASQFNKVTKTYTSNNDPELAAIMEVAPKVRHAVCA